MPVHVFECVCHSGRDWQIASYIFQHSERGENAEKGRLRRKKICRVNIKGSQAEVDD